MPDHTTPSVPPPAARETALWSHRPGLGDRLLAWAGLGERALRAALRRLAAGAAPVQAEDRLRLRAPARLPNGDRPTVNHGARDVREGAASAPLVFLPALPWDERFQRPQQLAAALASGGQAVLWVEAFLRTRIQPAVWVSAPRPGLRVVRFRLPGRPDPFRQPFPAAAIDVLAERLLPTDYATPVAVLAQLPFWAPLARELSRRSGSPLIYDRIDLHTSFPGVPPAVSEVEDGLLASCDLVTATSPHLAALSRQRSSRVRLLPNAVSPHSFAPAPYRPRPNRGVVGGFVGALDERIDGDALRETADRLSDWRFRFAGRVEDPALAKLADLPNVDLLGEISHSEVADFLAQLDVGLIPYRDTPLTRAIDPVKLYEMLAAGLPVAVRQLPGAGSDPGHEPLVTQAPWRRRPWVYPYADANALTSTLQTARDEDTEELHQARARWAHQESWDRRAEALLDHLAE